MSVWCVKYRALQGQSGYRIANPAIRGEIHLIALVSDNPGTLELGELSLAISTPEGVVIVVGCSHPGIDKIVAAASTLNPRVHLIAGGFHLVTAGDSDIDRIVTALHDQFKVDYIARPLHWGTCIHRTQKGFQ
jgi:metal-dependent hydrolase (beta-lactamase superfamily II)